MICKNCQQNFTITDADRQFYAKIDVPTPTLCPDCRHALRYLHRNERNLYLRKCDNCHKEMVSIYRPNSEYRVYCHDCYFSDAWAAEDYGCDFDFSLPFFEQFKKLKLQVPRLGLDILNCVNSDYSNISIDNKNCYLVFGTIHSEDCCYTRKCHGKDSMDINFGKEIELCYECIDCYHCYDLVFSQDCTDCSFSAFLYDCIGCENCFMCANLRHVQYYFMNQQLSKEEYQQKVARIKSYLKLQEYLKQFAEFKKKAIHRENHNYKSINCYGDYLVNCKKCEHCYDLSNSENSKYCTDAISGNSDSMDCSSVTMDCEGNYECSSCSDTKFSAFSSLSRDGNYNIYYCDGIYSSHDLFGCVGLRKKDHYILNKRYAEKDYLSQRQKIAEYMKKTGEWGHFFPADLSPFCYNETMSYDYYPLSQEQAEQLGHRWLPKDEKEYQKQNYKIPDNIDETPDEIISQILACEKCGKNYKIVKQELTFYRKMGLPLPHRCPTCRYYNRFAMRNPRKLWQDKCDKCRKEVMTSYDPAQERVVYCEECYRQEIY